MTDQTIHPALRTAGALARRVSDELLPRVRQPAQYIGGEINQLARPGDWERADVRVAVAFPDTYTIGMSHLGCQILYWLCNHTKGVCAERVYSPWTDAERVMRERDIPLFTWDTRQSVASADILAISLQYELCFTTVLNMLDLAGIPLRYAERMETGEGDSPRGPISSGGPVSSRGPISSGGPVSDRSFEGPAAAVGKDRSETGPPEVHSHPDWPLVIAGGPQADNPEPMAEFLDLVVIGDGEHSMAAILEAVRELKREGASRREMIESLARRFPWIYAPNLYEPSYHADGTPLTTIEASFVVKGTLAGLVPKVEGLPTHIERCQTPDFETAPFPTRPLVPWVEVVHDRISIEVMRGCPQRCRFCHAGYTKRPVGVRSVERIIEIAEESYWATGQKEIGLLSLSTADYPHLRELAERVNERFAPRMVNLSLPSLRVDKMLANIPWMAKSVRKAGLTIAVEAARDDMRAAIRKKVTDGNLLDGVRAAWDAGWNRVKLYFMAGFPGERPEDIDGIFEIAHAVADERRKLGKPPAKVNAAVSWLVPKPYTPFQWMAQPRVEYFRAVRSRLAALMRGAADRRRRSSVRIQTHDPEQSILEAVFARGDRRLGAVIFEAWRRGARLDGWTECFNPAIWQAAFACTGVDPDFYAHRERGYDERLPWDHIGSGPKRDYLERQYDDVFTKIAAGKPPAAAAAAAAAAGPAVASAASAVPLPML